MRFILRARSLWVVIIIVVFAFVAILTKKPIRLPYLGFIPSFLRMIAFGWVWLIID